MPAQSEQNPLYARFWPEARTLRLFHAAHSALKTGCNGAFEAALREAGGDWYPMIDEDPAPENPPLEWAVRRGVKELVTALESGDTEQFPSLADAFHFLPEGKPLYYGDYRKAYLLSQWRKPPFLKEMDSVFGYHKILRWRNPRIGKSR